MKKIITAAVFVSSIGSLALAQNPVLVKDIDTARYASSGPKELTSFNNKIYFVADGRRWNGFGMVGNRELWSSNGSAEGTKMVTDLNGTGSSNSSSGPVGLKVWKNKLYFFALGTDGKQNLYETDGSEAGTKQITTSGMSVMVSYGRTKGVFTEFNDALYFIGNDMVNGHELWKTDGTAAGTVMVKEINPAKGMFDTQSEIKQLTVMGGNLYFFANETSDEDSLQLWKSDGTTAGTTKVVSYKIGNSETVNSLTATSTHVYYTVNKSIYKSDGTTAGTALFLADCEPYHLTSFKGEMLFQTNSGTPYMAHLCITSNEPSGYTVLKDVAPNAVNLSTNSTYYYPMNVVDDKLYFSISVTGPLTELWQTDGTDAGTTRIKTLAQADGGIPGQQFMKHKGEIYFVTALNGKEFLNKTNGTEAGTVKFGTTGVEGIENLTSVENVLFFTSEGEDNTRIGEELFKLGTDTTSGGGGSTGVRVISEKESKLAIYPNPASDVLNIRMQDAADNIVAAAIYDITGKLVVQLEANAQTGFTCNVSNLVNGQYFLQVTTGAGVAVKRIVIAK